MAAGFFIGLAGLKLSHLPYKGTGAALTDSIGGSAPIGSASGSRKRSRSGAKWWP